MKTDRRPSEPWWANLPWSQVALGVGFLHLLRREPEFQEGLDILARSVAWALGAGGALWLALREPSAAPTDEDEFAHFGVVGLSRSGKTAWAVLKLLDWTRRGWGWSWLSIKGGRSLLPFLPEASVDTMDLISPTSKRPRGINMLKLTTGSPPEREQVADQMAEVVDRLHPATSDLMRELVRLGTLALLEYGVAVKREVSLLDLYLFFSHEERRRAILSRVTAPPVRQAFDPASGSNKTLEAVERQIRRLVSSRSVLLALAQTGPNQVDLRQAMASGRRVVVDASDSDLGPGQAALINEVIASKLQLFTASRNAKEPGFGVVADEVQEYQGAGHSFRRALALAAEYRVAWVLVNQYREGQLSAPMQAAVNLAGTHIFFRLAPADALPASKTLAQRATMEELVQLPKRHYYTAERCHGQPRLRSGITKDLPRERANVAQEIRRRNEQGPTADEIVGAAYRLMGPAKGDGLWA